jgi:CBS domain containing-hemolysin-like protein
MARFIHNRFGCLVLFIFVQTAGAPALAAGVTNTGAPTTDFTGSDVFLLVMYVSMALVFSFLCSVAESVLLSITPSYVAELQKDKPGKAAILKRLRQDNVDRSLAAILTLNTIAHTLGAIGAGAKATVIFGSYWFGLFSTIITLSILFLTEIIPKTLGAVYWHKLAGATALFVRSLIFILYPLILLSERLIRLIVRKKSAHVISRNELAAMAIIGEETGQINESESRMIRNLLRFGALQAKDIMTPRPVISALQQDMTVAEALDLKSNTPFSRLPLYRTDIDEISGFILKDDLLRAKSEGHGKTRLDGFKRDIPIIIEKMKLFNLLELMLDRRVHIALVVGEYGETKGLVTLEDVVETLLGLEIVDEVDKVVDMQLLARQQWIKRAKALGLEVEEPIATQTQHDQDSPKNTDK